MLLQIFQEKVLFSCIPARSQDLAGSCGILQESCRNIVQDSCKIPAKSLKILQDPTRSHKIAGMQEVGPFLGRSCKSVFTGLIITITNCSVSGILQDLDWPTLQYHRQRARLSLFYKSLHNLITLETSAYYIPNNHLSRLCIHHQISYIHPYARTNTYTYSFFPMTISK